MKKFAPFLLISILIISCHSSIVQTSKNWPPPELDQNNWYYQVRITDVPKIVDTVESISIPYQLNYMNNTDSYKWIELKIELLNICLTKSEWNKLNSFTFSNLDSTFYKTKKQNLNISYIPVNTTQANKSLNDLIDLYHEERLIYLSNTYIQNFRNEIRGALFAKLIFEGNRNFTSEFIELYKP